MTVRRVISAVIACACTLGPVTAWAQQASGIAGVVRDTSGAVLPGVTVEAASPVYIPTCSLSDRFNQVSGTLDAYFTDNLEVTPADYTPYCITAPVNPRLPGGGGYQVCGLYDLAPARFGRVNNLVRQASDFGEASRVSDFFNVNLNARVGSNLQFGGGFDTGRTVTDRCLVVDSPQALLNCRVVTPFAAQTQVKMFASYALPRGITVSGTFQNVAGPNITANYPAPNSVIAPQLGRNLAACGVQTVCNATATVPLMAPMTVFEPRRSQVDLRLAKSINLPG